LGGTEFSVTRPAVTGKLGYIMLTSSTNYIREVMTTETKKKEKHNRRKAQKKPEQGKREKREITEYFESMIL
jgi:CRISPR/Cas system-associated protein endoribonuclease Cas2